MGGIIQNNQVAIFILLFLLVASVFVIIMTLRFSRFYFQKLMADSEQSRRSFWHIKTRIMLYERPKKITFCETHRCFESHAVAVVLLVFPMKLQSKNRRNALEILKFYGWLGSWFYALAAMGMPKMAEGLAMSDEFGANCFKSFIRFWNGSEMKTLARNSSVRQVRLHSLAMTLPQSSD